ncbi:FAD/NAD(P)-binding domain-containing protein [Coprinopsis marcescibilis]|uniref:FAD/NAD(P)-binding domain-containing protein n=1 Tax=Coprinopsis marcescibilis TaxID=230819 RepID=A0A5C3KGM6_COPMA|nr:FAD/NAD(P)-binding domain-containing protein [Coprinopsis marcescibilis]
MSKESVQSIVFVGGGPASGMAARHILSSPNFDTSKHKVTFITPRSHYVHLIGVLRPLVTTEGDFHTRIFMPYDDTFLKGKGELKIGKVASIVEGPEKGEAVGEVVLESGERVSYDVLVLATGYAWQGPSDLPLDLRGASDHLKSWREKIEQAKSIVLIGGGAAGIEFSGEIKHYYPEKTVTIVHRGKQLLNDLYPEWWRNQVVDKTRSMGIDVLLQDQLESVETSSEGTVTTKKGQVIAADLVVPMWGGKPNTEFIGASLGSDVLTTNGQVKVTPTLQVVGHPRIFAGGDIIDRREYKLGTKAQAHGRVLGPNVLNLVLNRPGATLRQYGGVPDGVTITYGTANSITLLGIFGGLSFGNWLGWLTKKPKDLLTELYRRRFSLGFAKL